MKITKEHFDFLQTACKQVIERNPNMKQEYNDAGLSAMRYRWDICHKANILGFICDVLYKYLNDTHIDTALRNIVSYE